MKKLLLTIPLLLLVLGACQMDDDEQAHTLNVPTLEGSVQKGPFLNGTSIMVSELTEALLPTGKQFSTQITNNMGSFALSNVTLISSYVELKADGFYFNEVDNENASAQLTLYALSDLSDKNTLNVNCLTHLERNRVKTLMARGMDFEPAKAQAQQEILAIFDINEAVNTTSEALDITQPGDDHAILLAVSAILQGHQSVSELSELLANISEDVREDGVLDNQILGSTLINNAKKLDLETVRQHLENRYEALGLTVTVADFEKYVSHFMAQTDFVFTDTIVYPVSGTHGLNLLNQEELTYTAGDYSLKAVLPEGTHLKVKISGSNWVFPAFQENTGWDFSEWNANDQSRLFTAVRAGDVDFKIRLSYTQQPETGSVPGDTTNTSGSVPSNKLRLSVFENMAAEPTWSKELTVTP